MFNLDAFYTRLDEMTVAMYPAEDLESVRAAVYPPEQSKLLWLYMGDVQKRRPRGTPEDNPVVVDYSIWEKFFPQWKLKALNPNITIFTFPNPPEEEPTP